MYVSQKPQFYILFKLPWHRIERIIFSGSGPKPEGGAIDSMCRMVFRVKSNEETENISLN